MAAASGTGASPSSERLLQRVAPADVKGAIVDPVDDKTRAQAGAIVNQVRDGGEKALVDISLKFKDLEEGEALIMDRMAAAETVVAQATRRRGSARQGADYVITKDEMKAAFEALPKDQQGVLERAAERIRVFAQAQRDAIRDVEVAVPGGAAGHTVSPVRVAGCYAPGGRYPLPSSVLMTAVTARVAGVERVWVASPRPAAATIAAAHVAGADALLRVGGAQAIAAMAYGVGQVDPCDVIVGPGNRWVTAAKSLVSGRCGIDMLAGPSECLVLADGEADPALVAADLLAQAEHDTDALPVLVTDSAPLADAVDAEIVRQLAILPTRETAGVSVRKGFSVVCSSMEEAAGVSDVVAPEHLEVMTKDSKEFAKGLKNYGGLFIGARSAEVLGDYGIGPNHVLPTSGTGRYTGGLSVFTFLRVRTWLRSDEALAGSAEFQGAVQDAAALARIEGLRAHERAALRRVTDGGARLKEVEEEDARAEKEAAAGGK